MGLVYNNGGFFIWLKGKKKIVGTSPNLRTTRSQIKVIKDMFIRQLRSRGIVIQERRQFNKKATSMGGQQSKRKSSLELYRSIDNLSNMEKKRKKPVGVGIYTLHNTNSAIINVSFYVIFLAKA